MNVRDNASSQVVTEPLRRAIGERYLTYALSTIMHRALPDARDGLKPVHRRILFAMRELRLMADSGFRKSAKIAGDVMGNYHPHGDAAIYDSMVRLAQDFSIRYPLVDGQGNFGNIDGDNAAAARYTEARMTVFAEALLEGLNEDAVNFRDNYDGSRTEPVVLPAQFPNLLANGAAGIAVGMATNIPPHNIDELCRACLHLIKTPDARDDTLLNYVRGPDFPTGGVLVEDRATIADAYRTGRGSLRLRCQWHQEHLERGQWQIVVTEIPYQVQKSKLVEKVASIIQARKIPILTDVRDESADDVRLVFEPRSKNVDPELLMGMLWRHTDLETRFALNMNALIDGVTPKVCSLKEILRAFLDFRREILLRRSRYRLTQIDKRLELLEGLILAFLNLDRVIEIIRYDDDPKAALMRENWGVGTSAEAPRATSEADYISPPPGDGTLSETQTDGILNLRLRSLRKLEEMELRREQAELMQERAATEDLLENDDLQWREISKQIKSVQSQFGDSYRDGARRTEITAAPDTIEIIPEAMIEREPLTVICSQMGWVRSLSGHIDLDREFKFRDGDGARFIFHAETTDKILLFGSNGRFYTLNAGNLPKGRGMGEPVRLMTDLPNEAEIVAFFVFPPDEQLAVASALGNGFIIDANDVVARGRSGKQVLNLHETDIAVAVTRVNGDHLAVASNQGKLLVFPLSEVPHQSRGRGVRLQKLTTGGGKQPAAKGGGRLSDIKTFFLQDGIRWAMGGGRYRHEPDVSGWLGKRASVGKAVPHGFPKTNKFE
ncbi:MAG: DNA topoisomerase IV subunit A [Aestuariivita sp.]|nr:DNA topoisomerase IV subunit A [Aestuariivita sp.]MCY4345599.1 DNA topoisomerase IV subunit A [Aestuariivita sp.]